MIVGMISGLLVGVVFLVIVWRALPWRPSVMVMGWAALATALAVAIRSVCNGRYGDLVLLLSMWLIAAAASAAARAWTERSEATDDIPSGERKRAARPGGRSP